MPAEPAQQHLRLARAEFTSLLLSGDIIGCFDIPLFHDSTERAPLPPTKTRGSGHEPAFFLRIDCDRPHAHRLFCRGSLALVRQRSSRNYRRRLAPLKLRASFWNKFQELI